MKTRTAILALLLLILTVFASTQKTYAQCDIKIIGPSSGCAPFLATFHRINTATGKTISSVIWDYTAGTYSTTDTIVQLNFLKPGTYTVYITVIYTDGTKCTSTFSKSIIAYGPPKPKIILPALTRQCLLGNKFLFSENISLSSSGAPIKRILWNFGDGDTSTYFSPTHVYAAPGVYNVNVRIVDSNGCEGYDT